MTTAEVTRCDGPLVWFDISPLDGEEAAAVLECVCGYVEITGNFFDERHQKTPILRSSR